MANISENINNIVRSVTSLWSRSAGAEVKDISIPTSEIGSRYDSRMGQQLMAFDIFGVSSDYLTGVIDCKRLSENNPIFSGLMDRVVGPVADAESYVKIDKIDGREGHPMAKVITKDLNKLIEIVKWNDNKDEYLRHMLNEGGLSCEVIADSQGIVRALEYRPHYTIEPQLVNGKIVNPDEAYHQIDSLSREVIATFAKWQIAESTWKKSAFQTRGIPYLMASRRMLSSVGDMVNGVVSKWMRSGGEIEVFNLKNATQWKDVDEFKNNNLTDLTPNSKRLIRQLFTKGDVEVQRLHGDNMQDSTAVIEFLLELIFLATGVSKEVVGFKGHLVLKDMASISLDSYYRLLSRVQSRSHVVLRRACDIQLLTQVAKYGVLPEQVEYEIVGGSFASENTQTKIDTTVKVVNLLNTLMSQVENKEVVLEQVVGVLTYDLKDYGISFKEKLVVAAPVEPENSGGLQSKTTKTSKGDKSKQSQQTPTKSQELVTRKTTTEEVVKTEIHHGSPFKKKGK